MSKTPRQRLDALARAAYQCTKCRLHESRTHAVPGDGPAAADAVIVGEAPGEDEDREGHAFVGAAGRALDRTLERHGLERRQFFITNVVKCRPPENRDPRQDEVDTCTAHYLREQLDAVGPDVVMVLGRTAAKHLLGVTRLADTRGEVLERHGRRYVVGYHPAAAFYRDDLEEQIDEDFALLAKTLKR